VRGAPRQLITGEAVYSIIGSGFIVKLKYLIKMDNKIGETVIFTKDLHCRFSVENVEKLKVYSLSKKEFDNCEDWSGDEDNQCYKIADFNVEVSKDKTRFFYGDPIQYGYFRHKPEKLYFLPVGTCPTPEGFEVVGSDSFDEEYKVPGSMWDFGMFIDNFLFHVMGKRLELKNEYSRIRSEKRKLVNAETDDDLPF
jgi:hypothetical protein